MPLFWQASSMREMCFEDIVFPNMILTRHVLKYRNAPCWSRICRFMSVAQGKIPIFFLWILHVHPRNPCFASVRAAAVQNTRGLNFLSMYCKLMIIICIYCGACQMAFNLTMRMGSGVETGRIRTSDQRLRANLYDPRARPARARAFGSEFG